MTKLMDMAQVPCLAALLAHAEMALDGGSGALQAVAHAGLPFPQAGDDTTCAAMRSCDGSFT
jgi:hypothetical protein